MTGMLASVRSLEEARSVSECNIAILDLKDPAQGALGALPIEQVLRIVNAVKKQVTVSATIGDIPCDAGMLYPQIESMAATGVDIIKIGIFGKGINSTVLKMLHTFSKRNIRIVLVFFAEDLHENPDFSSLAGIGITGVMVDTRNKKTGTLRQKISDNRLSEFVTSARKAGLMSGLAGSLGLEDVFPLLQMRPDYLGFRGALCRHSRREDEIHSESVKQIYSLIHETDVTMPDWNIMTA